VFVVIFHSLGSNLRHSHVNLSYWSWLEKILVSPAQHQLHHSINPKHYDCNFGAVLAIWDNIGGSCIVSEKNQDIKFGLKDQSDNAHKLKNLIIGS
jgi:sterol desaturase/sphingolipid hydroxylase (fatty acid hydroxylase superfamily)